MKYFILPGFFIFCLAFFSCSGSNTADVKDNKGTTSLLAKLLTPFQSEPSVLTLMPEEYVAWIYEQKGITYSSVSNDQFDLKLIFHPAQLEAYSAAIANDEDPASVFLKYLEIQKGYYYCTAECTIRYESASDPIKKTELLEMLARQLVVAKNGTDTLSNIITEAFPSYVMNKPNKLLIMIPNTDSLSNYQITINGSPLHLNDVQLKLSSTDIKSFPLIKL